MTIESQKIITIIGAQKKLWRPNVQISSMKELTLPSYHLFFWIVVRVIFKRSQVFHVSYIYLVFCCCKWLSIATCNFKRLTISVWTLLHCSSLKKGGLVTSFPCWKVWNLTIPFIFYVCVFLHSDMLPWWR